MSYNGSGTFQINTSGQPVVTGTSISSTVFNALTADLATGLSTAITKDGQTTTTARIPFALGINSTLVTDATNTTSGSIITAGGVGIAKALFVGTTANVAGLTASSAVATDASKNLVSVTNTGTGNNVLATSPTLVTPALGTPASGVMTNVTGINYDGFKNRIINGAMVIDQRNAGAEVNPAVSGSYYLDRWIIGSTVASKFKIGQNAGSVTPPAGFINYLGCTSLSAYTPTGTQAFNIQQRIEGFNVSDLDFGKSTAKSITLSFWVYASLTGTFGGAIGNDANNRSYPFSYTISSANTWEQKSITIAGDTTGTWLTNNGVGIFLFFSLGAGSTTSGTAGAWAAADYRSATGATSVVGTNGATFYITGVQLEKGSTATSFDYRSYGTELALCQRYYFKNGGANQYVRIGIGPAISTTAALITIFMQTPMRAQPSSVTKTGVFGVWAGPTVFSVSDISLDSTSTSPYSTCLNCTSSGLTTGTTYQLIGNNDATASIALSAEL